MAGLSSREVDKLSPKAVLNGSIASSIDKILTHTATLLEFINKDLLAKTVSDLGISEQKLMGVFSEQKRMSIIKSDFNL